ncbi:MAG: family 16 glycosylhydrolase [Pseudomonadota bacterium]
MFKNAFLSALICAVAITGSALAEARGGADQDSDGVADDLDNCIDTPNASQTDSDGDSIGNACDADIAQPNDCVVNFLDLAVMKAAFFSGPGDIHWNPDADLNDDSVVNFADLGVTKSRFFTNLTTDNPSGLDNDCNFQLVFADEFDEGTAPSPDRWNFETGYGPGNSGWGNNEWQLYTDSPDNARIEDGNLVIQARCDNPPCGIRDNSVTSARITTQGKFDFRYGKVEARIKVPVGEGSWPAFWSLGDSFPIIGWPRCGEIDFLEVFQGLSDPNTSHFTMHWCDETIQAPEQCSFPEGWRLFSQSEVLSQSLGDDFHVYSAEWDAEQIVGKIDGITYFTRSIEPDTMEEFQREFFLILNVAMGGTLGSNSLPPSGNEVWPQTMLVDYVRVYQRPEDINAGGDNGLFIDFEEGSYAFVDFEGGASSIIANPEPTGINTSDTVAQLQKFSGAVFAGSTLARSVEVPAGGSFDMKVFASRPVAVLFKIEDGGIGQERSVMHGGTGWETLNFDFSTVPGSYLGITFIFDLGIVGDAGNNPDDWTFLVDDIELLAPAN